MARFIAFGEFSGVLSRSQGLLVFVLTNECAEAGHALIDRIQALIPDTAVYGMCTRGSDWPTLAFYRSGDEDPLFSRNGPDAPGSVHEWLAEAALVAAGRERRDAEAVRMADMLATEKLESFPPFFQMARSLARDAWHAARETAEGAPPLLLDSAAAAKRLSVCEGCASFRDARCVECGCFMTVKAHITSMKCPLDKWPAGDATGG